MKIGDIQAMLRRHGKGSIVLWEERRGASAFCMLFLNVREYVLIFWHMSPLNLKRMKLQPVLLALCQIKHLAQTAQIVPVPNISNANQLKDFRPITSMLSKFMEQVLTRHIWNSVVKDLDPLQFAYRGKRGTNDAVITL